MSFQSSSLDDPMSDIVNINDDMFTSSVDYNPVNNADLLRDIESLILSMEHKQTQSQQEEDTVEEENTMLRNIDSILSNIKLNESRPHSPQSNISVEPIRMKSPIMIARNDRGKVTAAKSVHHISEEVRNFVSNNIQEILPDLVGQVKLELTINDDADVFFDTTEQDDYFRNRHNEEFEEQLRTPPFMRATDDLESHLNDFFLSRHDEEFNERYSPTSRKIVITNNNNMERPEHIEVDKSLIDDYVDDDNVVNNVDHIDFLRQRNEEEYLETNESVDGPTKQQIEQINPMEPLKYKSSYNLKILKRHSKRNKRERDYKRRNSLILGSALLGIDMYPQEKQSSSHPQSTAFNSSNIEALNNLASAQNDSSNIADEKSINHESLITATSIANEMESLEINASAEMELHRVEGNNINDNVQQHNRNEVIESTIVEIIINEEARVTQQHYIINDDAATLGDMSSDIFDDFSNVTTPIPQSSSSVSINDSESIKAPQNLSELVEDTQRLIKQMKDEINAIYVSDEEEEDDDDLSGSRYTDEDNWVNSFDDNDEEYGSEYEDWSGEFIESTEPVERTLIEEALTEGREAFNHIIVNDETVHNNGGGQQQEVEIVITGRAPNIVNEPTQQATATVEFGESEESVVHGKLELALTPLSTNQDKVDASHIESANGDAGETFNANEGNLSDSSSTMAAAQRGEEKEANEISETKLLSLAASSSIEKSEATNETINNAIKGNESSIKSINEHIRTISFDEPENIVSRGNYDNHSQIALSTLPTSSSSPSPSQSSPKISSSLAHDDDDDGTNIDSVMNNSTTEVMPKLFDNNDDESIKLPETELNHDARTATEEIINSGTSDLTATSESATTSSSDVPASNERNEKSEEMLSNDEKSNSVKNDSSEYAREDMQMASAVTTQQQNDESQKSLIISVDVERRQTNEGVIAMRDDLQHHNSRREDVEMSKESHQNATSRGSSPSKGARSKIPTKKERSKETGQQLTNSEVTSPSTESNVKLTKTTNRKTSVDNIAASKKNSERKTSTGSSPFGVMLSSNIKSLQSQFLNKASTSSASLKPQITKLKPSKLVPPKTLSKDSSPPSTTTAAASATFANKPTKLITSSSMNESTKDVKGSNNNNTANDEEKQQQKRDEEPLKDHSKAILPKKNYMEHCFSDEYSTTTDDDEDDIKISPQRDLFTLPKKPNLDSDDDETSDVRIRYKQLIHSIFMRFCSFFPFLSRFT